MVVQVSKEDALKFARDVHDMPRRAGCKCPVSCPICRGREGKDIGNIFGGMVEMFTGMF